MGQGARYSLRGLHMGGGPSRHKNVAEKVLIFEPTIQSINQMVNEYITQRLHNKYFILSILFIIFLSSINLENVLEFSGPMTP